MGIVACLLILALGLAPGASAQVEGLPDTSGVENATGDLLGGEPEANTSEVERAVAGATGTSEASEEESEQPAASEDAGSAGRDTPGPGAGILAAAAAAASLLARRRAA